MDLPRFNAIASDNYPPQTQWLDVLLGNNYKVISIQPLTRQIPNVREQRMWGLLSMDGCLLSRLLDTSSQVLGTIWRCLGKPRGPLWRHFMATVISVSRNSNHSSYAHTLILGKQRWDSYFCYSAFWGVFCILLFCTMKNKFISPPGFWSCRRVNLRTWYCEKLVQSSMAFNHTFPLIA